MARSGAGTFMPADAGYAEPPDHRSRAVGGWNPGDADAHIKFGHRTLHACQDRSLGERDAGKARGNAGSIGYGPEHPDRRSSGDLQNRTGHSTARDDDSAGFCAGRNRAGCGAFAEHLTELQHGRKMALMRISYRLIAVIYRSILSIAA